MNRTNYFPRLEPAPENRHTATPIRHRKIAVLLSVFRPLPFDYKHDCATATGSQGRSPPRYFSDRLGIANISSLLQLVVVEMYADKIGCAATGNSQQPKTEDCNACPAGPLVQAYPLGCGLFAPVRVVSIGDAANLNHEFAASSK